MSRSRAALPTFIFCLLAALGDPHDAASQSCNCANASLVGDTVGTRLGGAPLVNRVVVNPGIELPNAGPTLGAAGSSPRWNIDFGTNTIRIDFLQSVATYGAGLYFDFSSLDPQLSGCPGVFISGITVNTNKPTTPFNVGAAATFGAHSVRIQIAPNSSSLNWNPGEFILVTLRYGCQQPQSPNCCDRLTAVPHPQQNLSLDYRTFTITNLKAPVSPICRVDISLSPAPPYKQGGDLYIDGVLVPTGTRFISPYHIIPNSGPPTITAINTVQFNLGIDYTLNPPWVGTVQFIVTHCDGSKCTLSYGPWTASKALLASSGDTFEVREDKALTGNLRSLSFQLKPRTRQRPIQWISFMAASPEDQIFAGQRPASNVRVEENGLGKSTVLYTFTRPLQSGEGSGLFDLVLRPTVPNPAVIIWTTYDTDGNAVETGVIPPRR